MEVSVTKRLAATIALCALWPAAAEADGTSFMTGDMTIRASSTNSNHLTWGDSLHSCDGTVARDSFVMAQTVAPERCDGTPSKVTVILYTVCLAGSDSVVAQFGRVDWPADGIYGSRWKIRRTVSLEQFISEVQRRIAGRHHPLVALQSPEVVRMLKRLHFRERCSSTSNVSRFMMLRAPVSAALERQLLTYRGAAYAH